MKKFLTLFTIILLSFKSYSQNFKNMTIIKTDNTQIKVSGIFMYQNKLIKGIRFKNAKTNLNITRLQEISKVIVGKNKYLVKNYDGEKYLFLQIISGELSLYKGKSNYYLENSKFGLKEIQRKEYKSIPVFKAGTVSLFINNCKLAVNELQQKSASLTLETLKNIINIYNTCDLSAEVQIADKIIEKSMKPDEKIKFGLSLGLMNLKTDYNKLLAIKTKNLDLVSIGAKVYFHSNMLDENLDFNISVDYFFEGQQIKDNSEYTLLSKTQFVKTMVATNYIFNNLDPKFKPYIGISAGLLFNSKSTVQLISKTISPPSKNYTANNGLIYNINAGTMIKILNKKIDFLVEYQPNIDMTLLKASDINLEKSSYNFSGLSFRLTYIF